MKRCDVFGLCDVISSHCSIKTGHCYVIMFLGGVLWGLIQHYEQRRLVMPKFTLRCQSCCLLSWRYCHQFKHADATMEHTISKSIIVMVQRGI